VVTPYWDPMDASTLWVPSPEVEGTRSVHMADWERRQAVARDLDRIVRYSLTCAADDTRVGDPGRVFEWLLASFELPTRRRVGPQAPLPCAVSSRSHVRFGTRWVRGYSLAGAPPF
jgi:hypothetical protein